MAFSDEDERHPAIRARELTRLAIVAAVGGGVTGVVGAVFRQILLWADAARGALIGWAQQWPLAGWVIPVTVAGALVAAAAWLVERFAPLAAGSGVQHVEAVTRGEATPAPLVVVPVKFIGGVMAIGAGLALGREGPIVQMGATIGAAVARRARLDASGVRTVHSAAAGAGLAVAFNTPLGGIAFVFEELTRRFSTEVVVATLAASATAMMIVRAIIGDEVDFDVSALTAPTVATVGAGLLLGILLGVLGALYNRTIVATLDRAAAFAAVPGPLRAAVVGGVVGLVAWFEPRLVGGGELLIQAALDPQLTWSLSLMAVVIFARWLLGPFSYAAGTPGGLFAPLLVIGALVGAMFARILGEMLPVVAITPAMGAIVGMAAFFTAVVRAPFTGILLALGMTGTIEPLLPVVAAALAAHIVPYALGSAPIYDTLRERMERTLVRKGSG